MSNKMTSPGAVPAALRDSPEMLALKAEWSALDRKQGAWRELRLLALERLRDTVEIPQGVECPEVRATGSRLAGTDSAAISAAFEEFQAALLARSRKTVSPSESKAIQRLATRVADLFQAMREAADKELEASRAHALVRAQVQKLIAEHKSGAGGIH
ncbi:hypothetical protein [Halomonas sp. C05BenzN]|uniref:hypothetical protein n=1 Tax=Halomonas sp. C05BenzN TaxID=3411041 RepID=UPI003B9449F5